MTMTEKGPRGWAIIIVSILVAGLCSYLVAKTTARSLVQAELVKIEVAEQKRILLEKQKVNKDIIQFLLNFKFERADDKQTIQVLQANLNDITARMYVYSPDDIVDKFKIYVRAENTEQREAALKELILVIRKETYEETEQQPEDVALPRASRVKEDKEKK